ncbi:Ger(x)C family spore germination C-terminal domain-containing protein [Chakrabartyella piscis]|uniref:Ger(x)C family spore germination protein n=1 Tax=Chakrabartyella piscis TaxID=2918914 RepID=UPI002958D702|nr:Ger(x)C family spore germination C-terminal domain-containing protein [Chakrabartyella piscis]
MTKCKIWFLCLLQILFLSGCMDGNDPENREYIITLGVDVAEDGFAFSFVPAKTRTTDTTLLKANGTTLAEGIATLDQENPRKTELGQLKMLVFSQDVLTSDSGYMHLLAELERSQDISGNVMLLATEDLASDCLQAILESDGETGLFLWDFYENTAGDVAVTWGEDLDGFLIALEEQRDSAILPKIATTDGNLSLGGGLLLQNHEYVTTLDVDSALGYAFLREEADGAVLVTTIPQNTQESIPVDTISTKTEEIPLSLRIMKNTTSYVMQTIGDTLYCTIVIDATGNLLGSGTQESFTEEGRLQLEQAFATRIKEEVTHTIEVAQDAGAVESIGIGAAIRRKYPDFDLEQDAWQLTLSVAVDVEDFGRIR